ncbi:MAG: hypothetical protein NTY96_09935 [Bacteroidetes bacterium]|nr:hypothetical protein [Bacteroidota bacterium]
MKTLGILICSVLLSFHLVYGQGSETFQNFPVLSGSYTNGSFPGMDGSEWTYLQCRGDKAIELPTPCLGKKRNPLSKIVSGVIHNGCRTIIFSYRQAFSTPVDLDLMINGELVKNVVSAGGNSDTGIIYSSDSIIVNIQGDLTIEFRQADSLNSGQVCIDNIFWTSFNSGLGNDEKIAIEYTVPQLKFLYKGERRIGVKFHTQGEKRLEIYSLAGKLVKEMIISGLQTDLPMDDCPEGMYIAILRDKEKNLISTGKLVLD